MKRRPSPRPAFARPAEGAASGLVRKVAALAACAALSLLGAGRTGAQQPPLPPAILGTPVENEAYQLYKDNKLITARARAQKALDEDPDSIIGHFVMGQVMHEAEGVLPRAMFHLGKSRELFETRWTANPGAGGPWRFHQELLFATQMLAGEMEEYDYQIEILDFHDALYDPDALAEHAWAFLHLRRFDDARRFAKDAMASKDTWQQSLGRNALCAIEGEARTRQPQYDACQEAYADARRRAAKDPAEATTDPTKGTATAVHAYNAALSAYAVLRYDEVERLAREGARRTEFTPANPWRLLARLYTDGGRVGEAVSAVREMREWRIRQPAQLRDQDRAETEVALATLLLVAGEADTAHRLVTRALERPDRRGLVSSHSDQAIGAAALLRRSVLHLQAELQAERGSVSGTLKRARAGFSGGLSRLAVYPDDERIASILADDTRLDSTLRFYQSGGIEPVPTWLLGDLVEVLGAGVVSVALEQAREEEKDFPALAPYFDSIEAEIHLTRGDNERAVELARRSADALPKAEALLGARVVAVGAEAAQRGGDEAGAVALFQRALLLDPGVIRRLGLAIPAVFRVQGSDEVVERAAVLVRRSPRLRESSRGFEVLIDRAGAEVRACLRSPAGTALSCSVVTPVKDETSDDRAARLVHDFHTNAFAMRVGLTQTDLKSLDGSTTLAGQAQREEMQGILKEIAEGTSRE